MQNLTLEMDRQGIQHYTLEKDQATTHRKVNKEVKMEVDMTHIQVKPPETITYQAITWNSPGKRRSDRPLNTWQRETGRDTK